MPETVRSLEAWDNLFDLFTPEGDDKPDMRRMLIVITAYRQLDIKAVSEGLDAGDRKHLILQGLQSDAYIDPEDDEKAKGQLGVIEQGYSVDPDHWEKWMGRMRRFSMDVKDMPKELGLE